MIERNVIVYDQWTFRDDDIHSGNIYLATSLMSDTLEANTFSATVECIDREILDFERNAPLTYYHRGVQRGIYYVQSITRVGPTTYTISATSAIGLLIEGLHYGGIYTGQTVAEVLLSICGTVPYVIKTNLREIALYGWLPIASPRDNLAQVLFAVGAVIKTDLDGVLHIEGLWDGISGTLGRDRMYMGPSVDYEAKVTQVVVTEHQYMEGGDQKDLFEGTAQDGDLITFDEPMYDLQAEGITILESNANYARVSAGSGTLTGRTYIHNTRQITQNVLQANEPNVKTVTEATLVSLVNSLAVAQRVANYYRSVQTINTPAVYQGESPGDLLSTWHPYDREAVSACMESADINISNTVRATESLLVGFLPIQIEEGGLVNTVEIISQSGTWTVPDGVTEIRAVLISGGQGGQGGTGGNGCAFTTGHAKDGSTIGPVDSDGIGASGGQPGNPGMGGRVYIAEMSVSPGQQISVSIGSGGSGGAGGAGGPRSSNSPGSASSSDGSPGTDGAEGNETTFGSLSSNSGTSSSAGFVEVISGTVYAAQGESGLPGGHGGGTYGGPAQGESLYGQSGGLPGGTRSGSNYTAQGGGGGGSAYGADGNHGTSAAYYHDNVTIDGSGPYTLYHVGVGGNGADAAKAVAASVFGTGGQGGHGGGGAGNVGGGYGRGDYAVGVFTNTQTSTARSNGGNGGDGGDGAPGCVIVYYSLPVVAESGPIVTSQNKYFLDKYGRKVVV